MVDARGCAVTGATADSLAAFERGLARTQRWQHGAMEDVTAAIEHARAFTMGHVLHAWLLLGSRDPEVARSAQAPLARAAALQGNPREALHVEGITAMLNDDYERAKRALGEVLWQYPRDVLALQMAHSLDYFTGDEAGMRHRVGAVLPAWSNAVPGYQGVLAMYAFGLAECGEYTDAERVARTALALDPANARLHHVMAHVFEMTERPEAGLRWMEEHATAWTDSIVTNHSWWHVGLFHLAMARVERARKVYDEHLRGHAGVSELIDASALLWRIELLDSGGRARWLELANAWEPHIHDRFCTFNDVHAMLAFVGSGDWARAERLERALCCSELNATRHGEITRLIGLPACRALMAFGRGNDAQALRLLRNLPALAQRIGGSHAQRDVLTLTAVAAKRRMEHEREGSAMLAAA